MAVWLVLVAGIQWEDRFYSGLNPVMPARASRFHGRASSRTPPFISISTLTEDEVKLLKKKKKVWLVKKNTITSRHYLVI